MNIDNIYIYIYNLKVIYKIKNKIKKNNKFYYFKINFN